ncbi:hypothetical protein [Endozoicomonas sp. 4G]|uniref:hypothetical protein n=1 Tax=Endozoicomonas sp. 4G TaxID=2872754 RepID=UPI0020789C4A|nr:hypothetical protein [Endozoicomonas sp. 4G]
MMNLLNTGSVPFNKNAITHKLKQFGNAASKFRQNTVSALKNAYGYMKSGDFSHSHYPGQSSEASRVSERAIARPPSERGVRLTTKSDQPASDNGNDLAARLESLKGDCAQAHTDQDLEAMRQKTADFLNHAKDKLQNHPEADKVLKSLNAAANLLNTSSEADNHVHEAAENLEKVLLTLKFDETSRLRDRHQQVKHIENQVADVCDMMHNLRGLVNDQGEEVSRIEDHITQTSDHVKASRDSLDSAQKSAKKGRKLKIVLGIVLAVIGITLLACLL